MKQWVLQQIRVRQSCTLSQYLSSIFTGDIVDYTKEGNRHNTSGTDNDVRVTVSG